jgi:hypothetical protein
LPGYNKVRSDTKVVIEARAEPEWDESFEDDPDLSAETAWMKNAETRLLLDAGIDVADIRWLVWEVTRYEEARWTIDAPEATVRSILAAGWGQIEQPA